MVLYYLFQEMTIMSLFQKVIMTILQPYFCFKYCCDYIVMTNLLYFASITPTICLPNPPFGKPLPLSYKYHYLSLVQR
ncbi:hypothetical protein I79_000070 [Cricetulus griseus]|uniref:Uncharacterized protein n=1 Tax=Cricetulus griseus TaxID=10029 RepID=G3GRC7_CRIGR|nr:hypothetical protein I79_000070 [Cricetulus griseus]